MPFPTAPDPEPTPKPRTAVVIVTHDQPENLRRCLDALAGSPCVIVVDNGARDTAGLDELYPGVRFIRLPRNFGRTKSLNIGIRAADAEYVLLLDPRVVIRAADVETLSDSLEYQPDAGAFCPLLVDAFGTPTLQARALPSTSTPDPPFRAAEPGERVECTSGHAILLRSFFLRALRHIDERFGEYGPAIEICQQIRRANKSMVIHPSVRGIEYAVNPRLNTLDAVDREIGTARYLGKHHGFVAGWSFLLGRILGAVATLQPRKAFLLISQRKIDGT